MSSPFITRKQAKELGYGYYYDGKPCPRGHIGTKRTSDNQCHDCEIEKRNQKIRRFRMRLRTGVKPRSRNPEIRAYCDRHKPWNMFDYA